VPGTPQLGLHPGRGVAQSAAWAHRGVQRHHVKGFSVGPNASAALLTRSGRARAGHEASDSSEGVDERPARARSPPDAY